MKRIQTGLVMIALLSVLITGCYSNTEEPDNQPDIPAQEKPAQKTAGKHTEKCGDGVCDQFEQDTGICPEDCQTEPQDEGYDDFQAEYEAINDNEFYVINPTSGSRLFVRINPSPASTNNIPTIIFIPGGTGDSAMFTDQIPGGSVVEQFSGAGFITVVFDPEGRGKSEGVEDYNGYIGQDGLYAITEFVKGQPNVGNIGYISQSYGVSLASGVLARYNDGPASFLIDWEGPANRNDITIGCRSTNTDITKQTGPSDHSCEDEGYWAEREGEMFASEIEVPYHRVQSVKDHVQPDVSHAVDMVNATTSKEYGGSGISPWTQLNDFEPNKIYSEAVENRLDENDKDKYSLIIRYAQDLFDQNWAENKSSSDTNAIQRGSGKVYFGFMVHLEGWRDEVNNRELFEKHMSAAIELANVFEDHGAKVTYEASPETIEASGTWDNILLDLQNRGHGLGVHADRGYSKNQNYNLRLFTAELEEMREDAESLGLIVQHVSGTCSHLDWAKASIDAGYLFTTGGVGYCAMSMPVELRPDEYKNCPSPDKCHGNMPIDMEDRIHPWRISTALGDWKVDDPDGGLVILASDGGIKNLYEASQDPTASHGDMEYSDEDIEILVEKVGEALELADPTKINILYLSLSIGAADVDTPFYNKMFDALQPYVESGLLEFKTMNEMYAEYIK